MMVFHSVNRSPGLASSYLRAFPLWQWLLRAFVSFTVTGIARKFHPIPLRPSIEKERRASLRRYTGYSFVYSTIRRIALFVNPLLKQIPNSVCGNEDNF
jgi:hypothetical protein